MSLADVERDHVLAAIAAFRTLGRMAFLAAYPSRLSHKLVLVHDGERFDLGSVIEAAHEAATGESLLTATVAPDEPTVFARMDDLDFEFRKLNVVPKSGITIGPYSWYR